MFINLAFLLTYFYAFFNFPGYGRALDMVALAIIPLFTFTKYVNPSNKAIISYNEFFLWLLIISLSVQSLFTTDTRAIISVISILGGLVTYMCLRKIKYIPDLKFIKNIGYLIVTVEFLELFLYYGFDYNLDLVKYFGGISNRGLNLDINMFRPSSIYQEPNQLSASLIFILTSVIFLPPKDLLVKKFKSNDGVLNKVLYHSSFLYV